MGQQQRPFVADPNEWEVINDEYEVVDEKTPTPKKQPTWSKSLGLQEPTTSPMVGFMRGAGSGVVDLAQGAVSNVLGQLNTKLDAENATRKSFGQPETATMPRVENPESFAGDVGNVMPMIAEMTIGGRPAAKAAIEAIPSTARAGRGFQEVMGAARNIPIETKAVGDAALRVQQLAERGSTMPQAVRKLLLRMTDPDKTPMVYEEARDFASNISRLSANEMGRLTPVMAKEVANLRVALNEANAQAAKAAGKLPEYKAAMQEYARAMRIKSAIDSAVQGAKRSLPYATAVGAGYWLTREVKSLLGGGGE